MKCALVKSISDYPVVTLGVMAMALVLVGCPNPPTTTPDQVVSTPDQVATPTFSPAGGQYGGDQLVTIACLTSRARMYYTTDGTAPTTSSAAYSNAIAVAGKGTSLTIKAIAVKSGMSDSVIAQASYSIPYPGTLETEFAPGAAADNPVYSFAVQSDGRILIGGSFTAYNGTARGSVARLNSDGSLDTSFLATGAGANFGVCSLAVQSDGKVLIGGWFGTYNAIGRGYVARLNSDGSLDTGFLATGAGANNTVRSVAVQSDGKVLIGGTFSSYNGTLLEYVARLGNDGRLENPVGLPLIAGANDWVYSVAVQSDGKILIAGLFTTYKKTSRGYVARLNNDTFLDTSFLATGVGANNWVYSVAVQSDGKILIGGNFTLYNGTSRGYVARLNSDGSLDTSFLATGAGANDWVYSVAVQSDGKILIGGDFTTYNGTNRGYLARLNSDGSLDTSFLATGAGANSYVNSVAVQSDGKILIGGNFTTYNGTIRGHIARLWN